MFCPFSHSKWKISEKLSSLGPIFGDERNIVTSKIIKKRREKITKRQQNENVHKGKYFSLRFSEIRVDKKKFTHRELIISLCYLSCTL